jgi:hypothetical protein
MDATTSSETLVYIKTTRRHIPQGGILHNHRCENLKSYIIFTLRYVKFKVEKKLLKELRRRRLNSNFTKNTFIQPDRKAQRPRVDAKHARER